MKREAFEVVGILTELGAVTTLHRQRKMRPPKHFHEKAYRFAGIHSAVLIHELPIVSS
jgi:hypothetical protein